MKSFVCLVFVLALIGLAQPALTNVYRFRHVESVEQKRSVSRCVLLYVFFLYPNIYMCKGSAIKKKRMKNEN